MAQHRHERHHARTARDGERRTARRGLPDEIAADRPAHFATVAGHDDLVHERGHLAALHALDGEVDLPGALRLGRDRIAPLRAIAVRGGEPDVVVLPGSMRHPTREREREALDLLRLGADRGDGGDLPLERRRHESPLYRSSFQGSPWLLYPSDSQKPWRSSAMIRSPRTHFEIGRAH